MEIEIQVADIVLTATLDDNDTAHAIIAALPVEGRANVWGEEIYFEIPVQAAPADDAVEEVAVGTLAFWPPGNAFCIFFGPTPVSTSNNPRAYSPVNIFGHINGDASLLTQVADGAKVSVSLCS